MPSSPRGWCSWGTGTSTGSSCIGRSRVGGDERVLDLRGRDAPVGGGGSQGSGHDPRGSDRRRPLALAGHEPRGRATAWTGRGGGGGRGGTRRVSAARAHRRRSPGAG